METSNLRGELEDIVRAGSGLVSVASEELEVQVNNNNNNNHQSGGNLSDEDEYCNNLYFNRDTSSTNYFPVDCDDDVFGDPFSNTRDPLSTPDEIIVSSTNEFIINPLPYTSRCSSSSSRGMILETLTHENNSKVVSGSEHNRRLVSPDEEITPPSTCMINLPPSTDQPDVSRLVQISTNDFNTRSNRNRNHNHAAVGDSSSSFASYDFSLPSSMNKNHNSGYMSSLADCNYSQSSTTTTTRVKAIDPSAGAGAGAVLNTISPNNSSVGCGLIDTTTSIRIHEISSSSLSPRNPILKRRKSQAKKVVCIPAPAGANSRQGGGEVVPSDLWAWRKYGQKPIKGSPYPRSYYRCSSSKGCSARKQVERSRTDPTMLVITYTSEHNHPWPTQRNALAGSTRTTTPVSSTPLISLKNESMEQQLDANNNSPSLSAGGGQCSSRLLEDDEHNSPNSSSSCFGQESMFVATGDHQPYMPFSSSSSLLMSHGFSTTASGRQMIATSNEDQKQPPFSSSTTPMTSIFDCPPH